MLNRKFLDYGFLVHEYLSSLDLGTNDSELFLTYTRMTEKYIHKVDKNYKHINTENRRFVKSNIEDLLRVYKNSPLGVKIKKLLEKYDWKSPPVEHFYSHDEHPQDKD